MRKKITLFIFLLLAGFSVALAQSITVKGRVVDQNSQPLPGVSVAVKSTQTGTLTDANGNYTISAAPNATLVFSYIGFTAQEVNVNNNTTINASLSEDVRSLNEVVVIGYGTQKKSVLTGSVSRVTAKDFANQQNVNIFDALKGRTSGVVAVQSSGAPGSTPTIRVRGITSINNSNPLYVVDGVVILNGGIENINPADIESFEVLKDASAAIYGSRASAGVVLVTTKKGKAGIPQVSYNGYVGIQNAVKRIDLVNATEYATLRNQARANDGEAPLFANPAQYGVGTNWQDQIFESNAKIQNHSLSVQGGSEKSTYYVSFGYLNQQGIIFPSVSNYKRYNFAVNTSAKPKKWLTIGENFQYAYTRSQGGVDPNNEFGGPLSSALNLDPITPAVVTGTVPSGNPYDKPNIIRDAQGRPYGISTLVENELTNPLALIQTIKGNFGWSHNILGNAFVEIEPIAGLKVRTQINGKQSFYGSQSFTPAFYLNTLRNNTLISANRNSDRNLTWNWDNTISYTRSIGDHNFSALIGSSAQQSQATYMGVLYENLPITRYEDLSFNFQLPRASRVGSSGEDQPYTTSSLFARLTYDYKEKYLFTGIIRRDGSSRFGSNNVYGTFPSAQVGWVVSKEDFFPKNSALTSLKLRASYGIVGNEQSLGAFQYTSVVGGGRNYIIGDQLIIGNSPLSPANADLKWEEVRTTNIGIDAMLFGNLSVTIDLYRKLTKGMLQPINLPGYAGFDAAYFANVGDLENKGIEVELGYSKRVGQVNLNFGGNISYNRNRVTFLGLTKFTTPAGTFQSTSYPIFRTQVGLPVASFYGFKSLGTFKSQAEIDAYTLNGNKIQPDAKPGDLKYADLSGDGAIKEDDRTSLGSQLPTYTYGLTLGADYKGFDFKVFGQGVWGNKLYQGYRRLDINSANYQRSALDAWTPQNPTSEHPRLTDKDPNKNYGNPSNYNLQSGAYFRIKTAQIGYTLPKSILSKVDVSRARIYVSSNNLLTITKYDGFDPEIAGGIDKGIYPQSRTFMLGLDITL
jgi:TonB-linked SusC/RagA family outer membrane protein